MHVRLAVFHANLALYERGEPRWIWGITNWPEQTWDLARRVSGEGVRITTAPGDVPAALLARYGLPSLVVVERRPTAWLLRPPVVGVSGEPLRERYEVPPPSCPHTERPPG